LHHVLAGFHKGPTPTSKTIILKNTFDGLPDATFIEEYNEFLEKFEVDYDERYIFGKI
jgi:hypothetical protein